MRSVAIVASLAAFAASVSALNIEFPDSFPLHKRQGVEPGTPAYNCHANCGGVIVVARTENYCKNSTYTSELAACLVCALEFNIWQYYGNSVSAAAKACGDDATPSPVAASGSSAAATTSPDAAASSSAPAEVSTTEAATTDAATTAAEPVSTTAAASSSPVSSSVGSSAGASTGAASITASGTTVSVSVVPSSVSTTPTVSSNATVSGASSTPTTVRFDGAASGLSSQGGLSLLATVLALGLGAIAFNA